MSTTRSSRRLTTLALTLALLSPGAALARVSTVRAVDGGDDGEGRGKKKPLKDSAAERIDWWRQRMGGDLSPEFMARLLREAERQRLEYSERFGSLAALTNNPLPEGLALPAAVSGTSWTSLGPTSSTKIQNGTTRTEINSGRLRTLLPDTGEPNTLYMLTAGGGLWKTNDLLSASPTWTSLSDALGSTAGGAAAFGRDTAGADAVIYMGAGDAFDANVGGFVTKSSNAGSTWSAPIQLNATGILDLKVDISTANDVILVGTNNGIFRSADNGANYAVVADADVSGKYVWSLVKTSAGWLAAVEDYSVANGTGSLALSTDLGASWTTLATSIAGIGRVTLGVGLPGDAVVYAFAANTADAAQLDLYHSSTGGISGSWTAVGLPGETTPTGENTDQPDMNIMKQQAFYNHMLLVDPTDATRNTVYLGGQLSTAKSTNARAVAPATSWTILTNWLPRSTWSAMPYAHADFHCAAFTNAGGTPRLLFGNDGGLALSSDGGDTFDHSKNKGVTSHLIYALASGPVCNPHSTLAGLQDNGTHNRNFPLDPAGSGTVWDQTKGGDGFGVGWSQANNATTLATYVYNDIDRSTSNPPDDQTKWSTFTTGLPGTPGNDGEYYFVTPIVTPAGAADPAGNIFFTYSAPNAGAASSASNRIFKSSGASWATIFRADTAPNTTTGLTTGRFVRAVSHGLGVHPTDINRIAAAGNGGVVAITTNGGTSWTETALGVSGTDGENIGWFGFNANVEWVDDNILYVCSEATGAGAAHVAKSIDGGANWVRMDSGLLDVPVTKIAADRGDATGNTLYAATWLGVYRTTNGGTSWSLFGSGLPQVRVTDLYVHPDSAFIRASTWGRGVWQLGTTPNNTPATTHPYGGTFTPGPTDIVMSVSAIPATFPFTYQWKRNGVNLANGGAPENISGATSATLTIGSPTCESAGVYSVTVSNCAGSITSNEAVWTASLPSIAITEHPANTRFTNGSAFALKVVAAGATGYQWYQNDVAMTNGPDYAGVTTATLSISGSDNSEDNTNYYCVVTLTGGCSATSRTAYIDNDSQGPNIVRDPANVTCATGANPTFTVKAGGGGASTAVTLSFQWRKNGMDLSNGGGKYSWTASSAVNINNAATQADATNTLTITGADAADAGLYDCVVTSTQPGSVTSTQASLTVQSYTPATAVSITPSTSLPANQGTPVTFTAAGSGATEVPGGGGAPASAYQYQFWVYWNDYLGWTMVQDYSTDNTWVLPGTTAVGTYGIGVNVRTNSSVPWDTFNSIDSFDIVNGGLRERSAGPAAGARPARPTFSEFQRAMADKKAAAQ